MRKSVLIITVSAFIILVLLLLHSQKYSIVDIDTDNYKRMAQIENASLCVDYFDFPPRMTPYLSQPQKLVSKPGFYEVGIEKNRDGTIAVYIHNHLLRLEFSMRLK